MKHLKQLTVFALVLFLTIQGFGQKIELLEGNLSALKGEKSIDFAYTYDSMTIGKGRKAMPESEYVSKKTAEYNKKTPGKGDEWAKAWKDDRDSRYQPAFSKNFEQYSSLQMAPNSKYTLIFKTTMTEPGFNMMAFRQPSQIDGQAWIVESANKSHVIAKMSLVKADGRDYWGSEFDTGERLTEAYEAAGRGLGYFVRGKM
jgi:hypothetical protein